MSKYSTCIVVFPVGDGAKCLKSSIFAEASCLIQFPYSGLWKSVFSLSLFLTWFSTGGFLSEVKVFLNLWVEVLFFLEQNCCTSLVVATSKDRVQISHIRRSRKGTQFLVFTLELIFLVILAGSSVLVIGFTMANRVEGGGGDKNALVTNSVNSSGSQLTGVQNWKWVPKNREEVLDEEEVEEADHPISANGEMLDNDEIEKSLEEENKDEGDTSLKELEDKEVEEDGTKDEGDEEVEEDGAKDDNDHSCAKECDIQDNQAFGVLGENQKQKTRKKKNVPSSMCRMKTISYKTGLSKANGPE
nr:hypothetical protein Iba_chr08aCG0410 [Ipomoea batatas]